MAPVDFALPHRCAGCGIIVSAGGSFCTECWRELDMLSGRGCTLCNLPMDIEGMVCAPCLATPPRHDGVLAAVAYGDVARTLALKLKYGRKPGAGRVMASMMARHAAAIPDAILVPVPLHRWRIWQRGFNQSLMLARFVSRATGQQVSVRPIYRARRTSPLGGLSRVARRREVQGAFKADSRQGQDVQGRDVLLVDDVYTTGATANACAALLKRMGARSVRILCWARVVRANSER